MSGFGIFRLTYILCFILCRLTVMWKQMWRVQSTTTMAKVSLLISVTPQRGEGRGRGYVQSTTTMAKVGPSERGGKGERYVQSTTTMAKVSPLINHCHPSEKGGKGGVCAVYNYNGKCRPANQCHPLERWGKGEGVCSLQLQWQRIQEYKVVYLTKKAYTYVSTRGVDITNVSWWPL